MKSELYCWFNPDFINKAIQYVESLCLKNDDVSSILSLLIDRLNCISKVKAFFPDITSIINKSYIDLEKISIVEFNRLVSSALTITNIKITAVIIVFNEERCIQRCLDSLVKVVDEIIVVDTGSTDSTLYILSHYNNIKVYNYTWENDFAKARNFAKSKVTEGWIFFIDADEWINTSFNLKNFLDHFDKFPNSDSLIISPSITGDDGHNSLFVPRIFKADSCINYFGKIHEEPRKNNTELINVALDFEIGHDGYIHEVMNDKNKVVRNISLLKDMLKIEPDNPRWVYFFVRDGLGTLDQNYSKEMLCDTLKIDKNSKLSIRNLKYNEYTFALLDLLVRIELQKRNFEELENVILPLLEHIIPDNSNSVYYNTIIAVSKLKAAYCELLHGTMKYRKNHFETQHGMLHSEGYHIDFLIAVLLFECGEYKKSIQYFKFLKNKYTDLGVMQHYKYVLDNLKEDL